jgi:RNA polymerase sigma-70 factor (ECF subfamily)
MARDTKAIQAEQTGRTIDRDPGHVETSATFETLFAEHWNRVCTLLFHLVGDQDEAQDLALEAFWRLYRCPPDDLNLTGWLHRVATNLGLNALRSRSRRKRYEQEAGFLELAQSTSPDPDNETELAEQRLLVRRILAMMPSRSAQILVLRHSGLTYAEIASALDLAVSSIGTLLVRAERDFEKRYLKAGRR